MTDEEAFELKRPELEEIPAEEVMDLDMPVHEAIHEAEVMSAAVNEDGADLEAVGLDRKYLKDLPLAISTLRVADARLLVSVNVPSEAVRTWDDLSVQGSELRKKVLKALTYASADYPEVRKKVDAIKKGSRSSDNNHDFAKMAMLGEAYPDLLRAINFDLSNIDLCREMAGKMSKAWGAAFGESRANPDVDLRNRALTYMRQIMDKIKGAAEYSFGEDENRFRRYRSDYQRRIRANSQQKSDDQLQPESAL